jgi:type I restriction enzyme S subunit
MRNSIKSTIKSSQIPYKLPENWKWFLWKDIMRSYQQGLIRSIKDLGGGNVSYLKMGDIDNTGKADLSNLKTTKANSKEIKDYALKEGDFLINVRNSMPLVGKTCIVNKIDDSTILFNHMLVRIDNGSVDMNYYLNAFLNTPTSQKLLDRIKEGTTTVIALYQRELNNLPIPLPDEYLFERIVQIEKKIRLKIEVNNKINQQLESMAKTLYDYWFVQFDFPISTALDTGSNVSSSESRERLASTKAKAGYKSSGGKMVYNEELKREIPDGWVVAELHSLTTVINRGIGPKYIEGDGIPVINQKCIRDKEINYDLARRHDLESKNTSKLIEEYDVLVNSTGVGTLGRSAVVKYLTESISTVDSHITIVRADKKKIQSAYLGFSITELQPYIEQLGVGSTGQTELSRVELGKLKIIIPAESLQTQFSKIIRSTWQKQSINQKENQKLVELRDLLLPMLMNGQVTVENLNSNDAGVVDGGLGRVAEGGIEYKKGNK